MKTSRLINIVVLMIGLHFVNHSMARGSTCARTATRSVANDGQASCTTNRVEAAFLDDIVVFACATVSNRATGRTAGVQGTMRFTKGWNDTLVVERRFDTVSGGTWRHNTAAIGQYRVRVTAAYIPSVHLPEPLREIARNLYSNVYGSVVTGNDAMFNPQQPSASPVCGSVR